MEFQGGRWRALRVAVAKAAEEAIKSRPIETVSIP
jgi:hypothetical protein